MMRYSYFIFQFRAVDQFSEFLYNISLRRPLKSMVDWCLSKHNDVYVLDIYLELRELEIIEQILENCWNVSAKNLMAFKLNPFWIRFILWWYDEEIAMEGIGTAGKIMCFCIFRILSRLRNSTNTCFVFIKEWEGINPF